MSFARKVLAGTALITFAGALSRLLSLLSVPILSHLLGPEAYGIASLLGTFVALAATLALMGIDMAYARFCLQDESTNKERIEQFCWRYACVGALTVSTTLGISWILFGGRWVSNGHVELAGFLVLATILSVLSTMATTRRRIAGNYRLIAGALIASAVVTTGVNLSLVWAGVLNQWALLGGVLAGSLTTLMLLRLPADPIFLRPSFLDPQTRRAVLFLAFSGSVTAPMHWIITSSDRLFLANYTDNATVGIYSVIINFVSVAMLLNNSLTLTWFPEASRIYEQRDADSLKSLGHLAGQLVVLLALVWVTMCAVGGGIVRILTAQDFHSGINLIPWLAGAIFFYGLTMLATTTFFLENKMRTVALIWVFGAAFNVILNLTLTPSLGAIGAAIAQCLSFGLIALSQIVLGRRVLRLPFEGYRVGLCLAVASTAGLIMSSPWCNAPFWDLALKLPVLVLVTFGLLKIIAPHWLKLAQSAVNRVRRKKVE